MRHKIHLRDVKPGNIITFNDTLYGPYVFYVVLCKRKTGVRVLRVDSHDSVTDFLNYKKYEHSDFNLLRVNKVSGGIDIQFA